MRTKVISLLKLEIHWDAHEIVDNSKTLTSPTGTFTSLKEFQTYIKKYEQKQLDLVNAEVWSITYLPTGRTTVTPSIYQGKVLFKLVPISLVA